MREEIELAFRADDGSLTALERRLEQVFERAIRQVQSGSRSMGSSGTPGQGKAGAGPGAPPGGGYGGGVGRFDPVAHARGSSQAESPLSTFASDAARGAGAGIQSLNPAALGVPGAVATAGAFGAGRSLIQSGFAAAGTAVGGPVGTVVGSVVGGAASAAFDKLEQDVRAPVERSAARLGAVAGSLAAGGVRVSDEDLHAAALAINRQERRRYEAEQRGQRFAYEVGYGGSSIQLGLSRLGL